MFRGKFSRDKMVLSRVQKLKRRLKVDTQKLRGKTLKALEELFDIAKELAKNEDLPLNVRRNWIGCERC
ncbi:MAG: hypothetical protein U9O89_05920 [Thermoproteota archaeon]|nr:hypothetical protein [Thermoproteota archaeon]